MPDSKTNRKPADRLADVREKIRVLEAEEAQLRSEFIGGEHDLVGDEFQVIVSVGKSERVDTRAIRECMSPKELKPYLRKIETTFVRTERRHG